MLLGIVVLTVFFAVDGAKAAQTKDTEGAISITSLGI
jgi:hypothetical protein